MTNMDNNSDDSLALLKQSVGVLKTQRHAVVLSWLLLSIVGIVGVSMMPNIYRATITILVEPQKIPERYVASTQTSDLNANLSTLTQQVLSASRLQEIEDKVNLYPELRKIKSREEILEIIRSKIKIVLNQGSEQGVSSFSIAYVDEDRWLVAPVANQLAASFIEWDAKSSQQQALATTEFLSTELAEAQKSLQQQEASLEHFRMQHAGATPEQLDANLQALSRLQSDIQASQDAISRLDEERILMTQRKPAEVRDPSTLSDRGRLTLQKISLENELQNLRQQYTDIYPDVGRLQSQLNDVNSKLAGLPAPVAGSASMYDNETQLRVALIDQQIERHKEQIDLLRREVESYQKKVQSVPLLETQIAELTRNYETSRQSYQSLLDKRLSAGMSEDLDRKQQAQPFTVLDLATTPDKPFAPKRGRMMIVAVMLSLVLSSAVAIGLDLLKGAIQSRADLNALLPPKVRVLATIPPIASASDVRDARRLTLQTVFIALLACASLIAFLWKVRPTL
jgi:succinoglycan biosynthesis transport protein ExoP